MKSFRNKIIITFILGVAILSFFVFSWYTDYISERIYQKAEEHIIEDYRTLRKVEYIAENTIHNANDYKTFLDSLQKSCCINKAHFLDSAGQLMYPVNSSETIDFKHNEGMQLQKASDSQISFSRIIFPVRTNKACKSCHSGHINNSGYLVVDYRHCETLHTPLSTQKYSLFFTLAFIVIIGGLIALLHYRVVKKSLSKFSLSLQNISEGNYNERVPIPESKELGRLAASFNTVLNKFNEARNEIYLCYQKETEYKEKMATVGEMAARLAHEIRNPVTGISNAAEILAEETQNESHSLILYEIRRQADRVNSVIGGLLNYSKNTELKLTPGDINELIHSVVFFLKNQTHDAKQIEFVFSPEMQLPLLNFDSEQLENSLLSMSVNAVQAIEKEGKILFSTHFDKEKMCILVIITDNGAGIDEDELNHIFKPFYTTKNKGTGLGLSIAKEIIQGHRGELKIESKAGQGTSIYIYLPVN